MEVKLNTFYYDKTYLSPSIATKQVSKFFIYDEEIYFHVEKVPMGLNFIDVMRFKNLMYSSIDGFVAQSYKVKEYMIFIYVKYAIKNKKSRVLLIEKIELLKKIINEDIGCELWIIKENKYKCVGMFNNHPVFFAIFDNNFDVNDSLDVLMSNINQYSPISNIRFFSCNRSDFENINTNTIEYSESFMSTLMDNEISLDRYCEKNCILNSKIRPIDMMMIYFMFFINSCSFLLYAVNKQVMRDCQEIESNISTLPRPISKQHYDAIVRVIEGRS